MYVKGSLKSDIVHCMSGTLGSLSNSSQCWEIWILQDCIVVQEMKMKVAAICSRPPQNVKLSTFKS